MDRILASMASILLRHGQNGHAELVSRVAIEEDPHRFADEVVSLAIWGGSGSVVDASFGDATDDRAFNELIVDLAQALEELGIGTPRTQWVGQTIEDWLISNPTI